MATSYPVLGEAFRIGDLIIAERPNFESRKICNLAPNQTVVKGQILGLLNTLGALNSAGSQQIGGISTAGVASPTTPTITGNSIGDVQSGLLTGLLGGAADVQILSASPNVVSGTFSIRYKGAIAYSISYSVSAASLQSTLQALHYDLQLSTVSGGNLNTGALTITTSIASLDALGIETIETLDIEDDTTWRLASSQTVAPVNVQHSGLGTSDAAGARVVALEAKASSSTITPILCLVREAMIKPVFLSLTNGTNPSPNFSSVSAAQLMCNRLLEKYGLAIVLTGPTYNSNQDVVGWANAVAEESLQIEGQGYANNATLGTPSQGIGSQYIAPNPPGV